MTGAKVLLFRSSRTVRDTREVSKRLDLEVIDLPADQESLIRHLTALQAP